MRASQDNKCLICLEHKADSPGKYVGLYVDHCHKTGEIRGLLCNQCNTGLGRFRDDKAIMRRAIKYLDRFDRAASQ